MREIKFRAWDIKNEIMTPAPMSKVYRNKYSLFGDIYLLEKEAFEDTVRVELMQYTGLKDKNGVEIYEGDICKLGYALSVVEYQVSQFVLKQNTTELYPNILAFEAYKNTVSEEIIGNIYENPELITTT